MPGLEKGKEGRREGRIEKAKKRGRRKGEREGDETRSAAHKNKNNVHAPVGLAVAAAPDTVGPCPGAPNDNNKQP
jgi:hypothetical protein